ncbi:hypothetical protein [Cypionkella sp. TWP1-2-1b2]|uniref:hypothetical protein n=1 Tax=Cypionkella sp. TWP1-2-1b2 TaxID=2804675 RepID=UPI003CEEE53C
MAVAVAGIIVVGTVVTTKAPTKIAAAQLSDTTIVAKLQTSSKIYPAELQAMLRATRAAPDDLVAAKAAAAGLIAEGRAAGDSRLVGAASGVLSPFMADADVETLNLLATVRQYQHDFTGALLMLDRALKHDPSNPSALLNRATIQIVLGRFDLAGSDCKRLSAVSRPELGFLCQSTALLLTDRAPLVYQRLQGIVDSPGLLDGSLRGWAIGLMGEIAKLQGDSKTAQKHFADVLAADPLALRERLLLSDLLLQDTAATEVLALLEPAPDVDGVLIRRVLAAEILGDQKMADAAKTELDRRFRLNLDLGLTAHAREEARYFLEIAGDPQLALQRAVVNWHLQHEFEDAQLLIDSAVAAKNPEAAAPVLAWMTEQSVVVPALNIPDSVRKAAK